MWLKLTTVQLIALDKKKPKQLSSLVRQSRINMDKINSYHQSPPECQNHPSEDARFNTILDATLVQEAGGVPYGVVFYVKETVEEIDDMLAAYGSEDKEPTPTVPLEMKIVQENTEIPKNVKDTWGGSGW